MKVKLIILLLIVPMVSHANYFDDNYIFGASIVNQFADIESNLNVKTSDTGSGFGLYFDYYYQQEYRFNSTLSYVSYGGFDITGLTLAADYIIPITTDFSLFTGATVGGVLQKFHTDSVSDSAAGYLYGVQVGGIKYLSDDYLIELGFRLRQTDLTVSTSTTNNATSTINSLNEFYFSVLFMF